MADETRFRHLLAVLDDVLNEPPPGWGNHSSMDEETRAVIDHLRGSPEAQVTLLVLAWEMKADTIDDEEVLRDELRAFAATIDDRFDVDLLRTAAANLASLPAEFPTQFLPDDTGDGDP
jgi:hypothetical protein